MSFSKSDKSLLVENLRGANKNIKKLTSSPKDIFELMSHIHVAHGDLIADAMTREGYKTRHHIMVKKRTIIIGVLIYNTTLKYVSEILKKSCMNTLLTDPENICLCKFSPEHGKVCPGINECITFNQIGDLRREYEYIPKK